VAADAKETIAVARVDLHNAIGDALQEVAIVRGDDERDARPFKEVLQPIDPLQIEVIRRLIHQKEIRLLDKLASDSKPLAPTAGEILDKHASVLEPQAPHHLACAHRPLVLLQQKIRKHLQ